MAKALAKDLFSVLQIHILYNTFCHCLCIFCFATIKSEITIKEREKKNQSHIIYT